jgi:hypothetical protein
MFSVHLITEKYTAILHADLVSSRNIDSYYSWHFFTIFSNNMLQNFIIILDVVINIIIIIIIIIIINGNISLQNYKLSLYWIHHRFAMLAMLVIFQF